MVDSTATRKSKNQYVHVLLHQGNLRPHKADLLTGYGVESVSDLTDAQIDDFTERLKSMVATNKSDAPKEIRKWRSNCIAAAEDYLGYRLLGETAWGNFNKFMLDPRISGRMMWELDEAELRTLHNKLRSMARKTGDKAEKENTIASKN